MDRSVNASPGGHSAPSLDRVDSVGGDVRVRIVTRVEDLRALGPAWATLSAENEASSIFLTWPWIEDWLATIHAGQPILTAVAEDAAGGLVAVAPFYVARMRLAKAIPYRCLRVLGDADSGAEYPDVLVRRGSEGTALPAIRRALLAARGWDCAWLPNLAGWSGAGARFDAIFAPEDCWAHTRPCEFAARDLPPTFDDFLKGLSGNARSNVKRQNAKLEAAHAVTFDACQDAASLPSYLDALYHLHQLRWQADGRDGAFVRRPVMRAFYDRFAATALGMGALRLFALRIEGEIRAVQYGYAWRGAFLQLQEGFDPAADSGAGNALRTRVFKACIEEGLTHYDFLGEFTEHKRRWGAEKRMGEDRFIGRRSLKNRLLFTKPVWPTGRYLVEG